MDSLAEFVQMAEMSQKKFEGLRGADAVIVNTNEIIASGANDRAGVMNKFLNQESIQNPKYTPLKIPRRPEWNKDMEAHEIQMNENMAFLEWRRDLALVEENNVKLAITPFEKNIEVWRQLWRVIEKSDILLQIVDARNPYFFYSGDLEKYIRECKGNKEFILVINKADYLTQDLITHWNGYFKEKGVNHVFVSALKEQEKLDTVIDSSSDESDDSNEEEEKEFVPLFDELKKKIDIENELKEINGETQPIEEPKRVAGQINTTEIFTREDILGVLKARAKMLNKDHEDRLMVGTVGYPNVGKSSLINVLCGRKRVGVAAMPGKTKHFQTLLLEDESREICLVDCPGLVFPSFANSKAEMYCCGVLPIQNIREYLSPCSLIISRVPKEVLEKYYKIKLPPRDHHKYTTTNFLSMFALQKGWITGGSSNPNIAEAAKVVIKDYTTGSLVFCHVRPDFDKAKHQAILQSGFGIIQNESIIPSSAQDYT